MSRQNRLSLTLLSEPNRRVARAIVACTTVVLFGTVGLMIIEGWDVWQSLFFTLITITTVGYSEYGLSDAGERFASVLIIGGIAVFTYSAGQVIPGLLDAQLRRKWKMDRQIAALRDHYIVCGLGRIGRAVCARLSREGVPFVALDHDQAAVELAVEAGMLATVGDATQDECLVDVGVHQAKGIACVTNSDTENIVITLTARELNKDLFIIARAEAEHTSRKIQQAGASRVISPIRAGGVSIANAILKPHLSDFLDRSDDCEDQVQLAEVTVGDGTGLDGKSVEEVGDTYRTVVLVAVKPVDGNPKMRPAADTILSKGDVLIVAGDDDSVASLRGDSSRKVSAAA